MKDTMSELNKLRGGVFDRGSSRLSSKRKRRRLAKLAGWVSTTVLVSGLVLTWSAFTASTIKTELEDVATLTPQLKDHIFHERKTEASNTAHAIQLHTAAARRAANDPLWVMLSAIPWLGANFSATTELTRSADDVATLGILPLTNVMENLNWDQLVPGNESADLGPLKAAAPSVTSAANAVRMSSERLDAIDSKGLLPQIAEPLNRARDELRSARGTLDVAANASKLAPSMLGGDGERRYLLLIQNNAETRATGGIPGALAVLTARNGILKLDSQTSASEIDPFVPGVAVDPEQEKIYSGRLAKFMQDVNLTPDFPTTAATAKTMWEKRTGTALDGVVSIDPIALGYILDATGPVRISDLDVGSSHVDMPSELNGKNVVKTLLSDVYSKIADPRLQDAYFAAVSGEIFHALSGRTASAKQFLEGVAKGSSEHRILVWSSHGDEQGVLSQYQLSGSISGPSVAPTQFGVYFNDGTGAKMDYYVKRSVQLVTKCTVDGYGQVAVRVTSTNTAPADAAKSLPVYVTGGGAFGIEPGSVQTNVVVYGPTQAHIEQATQDGNRIPFNSQVHAERPVGVVATLLKPGQSSTVEFTFDKIVQHTKPELVVTPTTDAVKNVVMDTMTESCNSSR